MIQVKLPDGSARSLDDGASSADLAAQIGAGLAKAAVAAKVNGKVRDLQLPLADGDEVSILTKKDAEALEVLRHSAAHLMADAILRIFPKAELTIGPVVEDGFYYDIFMKDGKITPDDFEKIEAESGAEDEDRSLRRRRGKGADDDAQATPSAAAGSWMPWGWGGAGGAGASSGVEQ